MSVTEWKSLCDSPSRHCVTLYHRRQPSPSTERRICDPTLWGPYTSCGMGRYGSNAHDTAQ